MIEIVMPMAFLAVAGIVFGIVSNLERRFLGNMTFNFMLIGAFFWYQYLADKLEWRRIPLPIMIFFGGYVLGTYGSRILGIA